MKKYNRKIRKWLKSERFYNRYGWGERKEYTLLIYSKHSKIICERLGYSDLPF